MSMIVLNHIKIVASSPLSNPFRVPHKNLYQNDTLLIAVSTTKKILCNKKLSS